MYKLFRYARTLLLALALLASRGIITVLAFSDGGRTEPVALVSRSTPDVDEDDSGEDDDDVETPSPTDNDGFDTPATDYDGIDTPLTTDNDGENTPYTDYDGFDTPLTTDNDGVDTPLTTDNDGGKHASYHRLTTASIRRRPTTPAPTLTSSNLATPSISSRLSMAFHSRHWSGSTTSKMRIALMLDSG